MVVGAGGGGHWQQISCTGTKSWDRFRFGGLGTTPLREVIGAGSGAGSGSKLRVKGVIPSPNLLLMMSINLYGHKGLPFSVSL